MKLGIKLRGISELMDKLQALLDDSLRRSVVDAMAAELLAVTESNFRSERLRPATWAPLAESTLKRKKKDTGMLINHGTMVRGFSVENATAEGAEIANTQKYAVYHQFGTKKMPARPFVPVTGEYGSNLEPILEAGTRMKEAGATALKVAFERAGLM